MPRTTNAAIALLTLCLTRGLAAGGEPPCPYLTTPFRATLLSANDGEIRFLHTRDGTRQEPVQDSITVIRLYPDHPPVSKTVAGTVPSTIYGAPHIAISADGRFGFVTNHSWRYQSAATQQQPPAEHLPNLLTVIHLAADDLPVLDQVKLPAEPWMVDLHPDGQKVIVAVGAGFHVYSVEKEQAKLVSEAKAPNRVTSFDVSPVIASSVSPRNSTELRTESLTRIRASPVQPVRRPNCPSPPGRRGKRGGTHCTTFFPADQPRREAGHRSSRLGNRRKGDSRRRADRRS